MIGYWFSREDGRTEHLKTPAQIGHSHRFRGKPIPCEQGLHASPTPWDALQYACGSIMWEVKIPDDSVSHGSPINKYATKSRKYLRKVDLTRTCYQFAAQQALNVIKHLEPPDIIREYLTDEAKGIDRSDIRDAARDASWGASWGAARGAAWDAARGAARDAARDASWGAAWGAARGAAWDAAWDAAKRSFNGVALEALERTMDSN